MALKRKAYDQLLKWKNKSAGKTALLIEGARRVGKTHLTQRFAENEYASHLIIDFTTAPRDVLTFFEDLRNDLDSFFLYLSTFYGVKLQERDSLIVFDEVQAFPQAREALKQLVADGRYDYIETGSLVSIRENVTDILVPSEERAMELSPLDFMEFLWALDEQPLAELIEQSFQNLTPLPDALHKKAARYFREYLLVGGMPQAVVEYTASRDMDAVDQIKQDILRLYRNDMAKTASPQIRRRIIAVFDNLPGQLSKAEKKFTLASLDQTARMRDLEDSFFWLADARIVNACFNSTDPQVGLALNEERTTVKLYMADTGLLVSHAFSDRGKVPAQLYRDILLGKLEINEGMLTENIVAQLLKTNQHRLYFYSRYSENAADRMEIDFLIQAPYANAAGRSRISPIEVKSTRRYGTKSLEKFRTKFGSRVGTSYVLHPGQLKADKNHRHVALPLYMAGCL